MPDKISGLEKARIAAILALEHYEFKCDENISMFDACSDSVPDAAQQLFDNAKAALALIQQEEVNNAASF